MVIIQGMDITILLFFSNRDYKKKAVLQDIEQTKIGILRDFGGNWTWDILVIQKYYYVTNLVELFKRTN